MANVSVVRSPLAGVPRALPVVNRLHHSVIIASLDQSERYVSDVIPTNPTNPIRLLSLVAGQTVPAIARCKRLSRKELLGDAHVVRSFTVADVQPSVLATAARQFQLEYFGDKPELNLYHENCVLFATYVIVG